MTRRQHLARIAGRLHGRDRCGGVRDTDTMSVSRSGRVLEDFGLSLLRAPGQAFSAMRRGTDAAPPLGPPRRSIR